VKTRTIVPHLPAKTRARVLASARATVASGGASPPAPLLEVQAPVPPPLPRRWIQPVVRISLAALAALAAASVGAVLALRARPDRRPPVVGQQQLPLVAPPVGTATAPFRPPAPAAMEEPSVGVTSTRPPRRAGARARFTAGLELLQRAHAAYTRHEFLGALALIGEHARRFPAGSLAEEREALRVRALLGCGRVEEAQHAAATFAVRFPRSVLLPRVHDQDKAPE
jgi:hypothetical protein